MRLAQHQPPLGPMIERVAEQIHEFYVSEELDKKDEKGNPLYQLGDWASLVHWKDLDEMYKRSNREQAAHYPTLLAAAGCSFEEGNPDSKFEFSDETADKLALMEHDRWVEERRVKQPDHPDLVPWEKLDQEQKVKDIRTVKKIPELLGKVGLRIVHL